MLEWLIFGPLAVVIVLVVLTGVVRLVCGYRTGHTWTTDDRGFLCKDCGLRPWID